MQLMLFTWDTTSEVYSDGITKTLDQQRADLEASYKKIATPLQFLDAFGEPPALNGGVYFTALTQNIPSYSTIQKPYVLYDVEFTQAAGTTI